MAASTGDVQNIEKLIDGESYQIWKFQITVAFRANGVYQVVSGDSLQETQRTAEDKTSWEKKDALAQKLIVTTVDRKLVTHLFNCKTAKDMFEKLVAIFEKGSEEQKCALLQQFYTISYESGTDMSMYISQIENIVYKLEAMNQEISEAMVMSKILSTLPENYRHFITAWESTPEAERNLTKLTARLLTEESRNKTIESEDTTAFKALERYCFKCRSRTHFTRNCRRLRDEGRKSWSQQTREKKNCDMPGPSSNGRQLRECGICKKTNHAEKDCFFKSRQRHGQKPPNRTAFLTRNSSTENVNPISFVIDSGSTAHMSNNPQIFTDFKRMKSDVSLAKRGEKMQSEGMGNVEASSCVLKNVLLVPNLSKNLLSVNCVTENNGIVIFTKDKVIIKSNRRKVLEGRKRNGLYVVDLKQSEESNLVQTGDIQDWHRKLGHLGTANMERLLELSTGMNISRDECRNLRQCLTCLKAKQTKLPFSTERRRATRPLEVIHSDVCGPVDPPTWDGRRYFLTVLDDYTHFCQVYLLRSKAETPMYLKEFVKEAEAYKNIKVHKIRCDNGGEYTSINFRNWCRNRGIVLDYTIPNTPQLNGKAERLNRTLLEKARALILDRGVDHKFWGEAVCVAAYLSNRSPSRTVEKTPTENWTNCKPDLSRLQIFGSIAYAREMKPRGKLGSRSRRYLFVGYAPNGYRLFDENQARIVVRRDLVFERENPESSTTQPFPDSCEERSEIEDVEDQDKETMEQENEADEEENQENLQQDVQRRFARDRNSREKTSRERRPEFIAEEATDENSEEIDQSSRESDSRDNPQNQENAEYQETEENTENRANTDANHEVQERRPDQNLKTTRSGRRVKPPRYLQNYEANLSTLTFDEAINGPDKENWQEAIKEEKDSLERNGTWIYVNKGQAEGRKLLTSRWVFKIKENQKFKARLVVKGCQQRKGIDYAETFSPVVNMSSIRILLALAARKNLKISKFDIKTAFLYGTLNEQIFMKVPEGYDTKKDKVCLLKKSLYGLKQAPLRWNERFTAYLKSKDMKALRTDKCLFRNKKGTLFLGIYVDDGLLVYKEENEKKNFLKTLQEEFQMTAEDNPQNFLGIEIARKEGEIKLSQKQYIEEVLEKCSMMNAKPVKTPMAEDKTSDAQSRDRQNPEFKTRFREMVGSLLYLTNKTRPDLAYAVNHCCRRMEEPTSKDWENIKRILKYLVDKKTHGISFKAGTRELNLTAYSDSDFAGDPTTRKSTTGYIVMLNNNPINWCSRKQPIVSLSSTEAEYIAAADCVKEVLYLKSVVKELTEEEVKVTLKVDNQSAITLMRTGQFNKRSKHIDVRYHFINEKIEDGQIEVEYCATEDQVADIFTKPLNANKFVKFRRQMMSEDESEVKLQELKREC